MTDPVAPDEMLTRYIVYSGWIRQSDNKIRPDAFVPPPNLELSVTRHLGLTETDIWRIGKMAAGQWPRHLCGRADVVAQHISNQNLAIVPQPVPHNPNHANIVGWPKEKEQIKGIALQIAKAVCFVAYSE